MKLAIHDFMQAASVMLSVILSAISVASFCAGEPTSTGWSFVAAAIFFAFLLPRILTFVFMKYDSDGGLGWANLIQDSINDGHISPSGDVILSDPWRPLHLVASFVIKGEIATVSIFVVTRRTKVHVIGESTTTFMDGEKRVLVPNNIGPICATLLYRKSKKAVRNDFRKTLHKSVGQVLEELNGKLH